MKGEPRRQVTMKRSVIVDRKVTWLTKRGVRIGVWKGQSEIDAWKTKEYGSGRESDVANDSRNG